MNDRIITIEFTDQEFCVLNTILLNAKSNLNISSRDIIPFESLLIAFADISSQTQVRPLRLLPREG